MKKEEKRNYIGKDLIECSKNSSEIIRIKNKEERRELKKEIRELKKILRIYERQLMEKPIRKGVQIFRK